MVDPITSLYGSNGEALPVSEMYDNLNKIHNILDWDVSK